MIMTKFVINIVIMTTTAIRERLYDYIRVADDEKVEAIYTLLKDQITPAMDWSEDEEFVAELDERVRRYDAGIDRGYTWDELEASIEDLRKKRAKKWTIPFYSYLKRKMKLSRPGNDMKKSKRV